MFEWNDNSNTGIAKIDNQHRELFAIGKKVYLMTNSPASYEKASQLISIYMELTTYINYHFETEERILKENDYYDLESHIKEHEEFRNYINSISIKDMEDKQNKTIVSTIRFIDGWIKKHIDSTDMKYVDHILKK